MNRSLLNAAGLALILAVPFAWLACGGGKPPETPADEANAEGGAAPAASSAEATNEAPAASTAEAPAPAPTPAAAPAPPPPPAMSDTDCGKCIDKTCAKPAATCGKNTDCQAMIDSFRSCGSDKGAASCLGSASMPSAGKPKKLAGAYAACAKKALTSKACKASCK
jgi:hypothetical protein